MLGGHLLVSSATTQNVVATSSGEAEFYALAKSASRALGAVAMAADMVKVVKPRVQVHATASKAIASRHGVGRVRHLHTQVLWVQEAVVRRELTNVKVTGIENPADVGTKHLAEKERHECMRRAGCRIVGDVRSLRSTSPGRLESAALRLRSRTSIEVDKRSRISIEIDERSRTSMKIGNN